MWKLHGVRSPFGRPGILLAEDEEATPGEVFELIYPFFEEENIQEIYFAFGWMSNGSGLGWPPSEVDKLNLDALQWYLDRITEQRNAEARAAKG